MSAICDLCAGIAAEKGYLNQREEERARQMEQYALSCHVGELKSRLIFTGVLISIFQAGIISMVPSMYPLLYPDISVW
jgi:hypothetical protein